MKDIIRIETISQACKLMGIETPKHPLVTIVMHEDFKLSKDLMNKQIVFDLYQITYKTCPDGSFGYGRNTYDFQEGTMIFTKPGQVIRIKDNEHDESQMKGGWTILFHPDLIRRSQLGKHIDDYTFFSYDANEALHLSDDEKLMISDLRNKIRAEYSMNIDKHSQKLIIANIELMLGYCTRFYDRQFYTRENINKDIITRLEHLMKEYYNAEKAIESGVPSVKYCATQLNMSSNYLSDLLKKETGRNTLEHIHNFVVERAKNMLLTTNYSISQVAYILGFEYPQHFSKVFKKKTGISPAEYRNVS